MKKDKSRIILRKKVVNTYSIDERLLNEFRKKVKAEGESMSGVIVSCVKKYVKEK